MAATVHFPVRRFHGLPCHGVTGLTQRKDQPETGLHIGKVVRRQPAGTLYEPSLTEAACLRHDKD